MNFFNIVLVEPEIPQNTGNIVRVCAGTRTVLHLIHPLGFSTEDKYLKRAGLDYWKYVEINHYDNFDDFLNKNLAHRHRMFFLTTKSPTPYYKISFNAGDFFVFGKETKGLSDEILRKFWKQTLTIPIVGKVRSFNLSNSAAIVLFEALRQNNFFNQ